MRFNAYLDMQKSKKMMVSLCGLALSSLFILNNKAVVHADAVTDGSQNNAISWDSDSDTAQGVQNTQSTQKADDNQQNAQSVQPSRAETSTVRSVSEAPRTTNQTVAVQSPKISNINDAQAAVPVVINNPANNKVHVHYVDSNGNAVENSTHDYDIDATKTGQGQYNVPTDSKGNKYQLNYPDGKYTVSGGAFNGTNMHASINFVAPTYEQHLSTGNAVDDKILQDHGALDLANKIEIDYVTGTAGSYTGPMKTVVTQITGTDTAYYKPDDQYSWSTMSEPMHRSLGLTGGYENWSTDKVMSDSELDSMYSQGSDKVVQYMSVQTKPGYTNQTLPVAFVDSNNNIVGMIQNYSGKVGTTQNVSLTVPTGYKLADGQTMPTSVTFQNSTNPLLVKVVPSGKTQSVTNPANNTINVKFVDQESGQQVGSSTIDLTKAQSGTNYYNVPKGYGAANNSYQVGTTGYSWKETENLWTNTTGKTSGTFKADDDGLLYTYKMFGVDPNKELKVKYASSDRDYVEANGKGYSLEDYHDALSDNLQVTASQYQKLVDFWKSFGFKPTDGYPTYFTFAPSHGLTDAYNTISGNTVTVPVHKTNSFSFADNSGNVKSVNGNTVDVTLTKPQSVNPASDTRCQAQATRTIQINFPDGQIPQSYNGIVDKSGKLVQTVHFTRTATEDALTGNILQYGSWTSDNKDHNFIGFEARTLPRIPGYTLSIKPA